MVIEASLVEVLGTFTQAVQDMESTVLFPTKLNDLSFQDLHIARKTSPQMCVHQNMNLRSFFSMVKEIQTALAFGKKTDPLVREDNIGFERKLREASGTVNRLTELTKYIIYCEYEIMERTQPMSFQKFQATRKYIPAESLADAVRKFVQEVEVMEHEVMFPSFLMDYKAGELIELPVFSVTGSESESLKEVFQGLKELKTRMVWNYQTLAIADLKFFDELLELRSDFSCFAAMTRNLIRLYLEEVYCNFC